MLDEQLLRAVDRIDLMAYDECTVTPCQHSSIGESDGRINIPLSSLSLSLSLLCAAHSRCISDEAPLFLVLSSPPRSPFPSSSSSSCQIILGIPAYARRETKPSEVAGEGDGREGLGFRV